jgi:tetratricopeptide (TPR) repeat protein
MEMANRIAEHLGTRAKHGTQSMNSIRLSTGFALFCLGISVALPCVSKASTHGCRYYSVSSAKEQVDAFQTGLTALQENRFDDALVALTAAEYQHSEDPRIRNFRGIVLDRLGRTMEAAAEYQEAIRIDPRLEDAYRNLGFLRWKENYLESARGVLLRALELSPDDSFAHYYLGRVQLDELQYAEALKHLKLSSVPWPAEPEFLIQVAAAYESLKQTDDVRKTLDQLESLSLNDSQLARGAELRLAVHDNDKAIETLTKSVLRLPAASASWAQFDLALVYLLSGKYQEALQEAHSFVTSERTTPDQPAELAAAWSVLGIALARRGNGEQSVNALNRAAALDPYNEEAWLNLTRELMELNRYAEAISTTQKGITSNPNSYALHLRLGAAYLAAGRYPEAEDVFRALVSAGDPLPTSYIGLAQVLMREGRAEEAASALVAARQVIGRSFLLSYFTGLSYERSGKSEEAVSAYREAVELNPTNSEAHLGLGKSQLASGRVIDAIAELEEALRLSPGNLQARRLLSRAYQGVGNRERAGQYAESPASEDPVPEGNLLGDFFLPRWKTP